MKGLLFLGGFFAVAFAIVPFFSPEDPERVGVEGSLLLFGLFAATVSCVAYRLAARSYELPFAKSASLALGGACGAAFYVTVAVAIPPFTFPLGLGLATASATLFAVGVPALARRAVVQQAVQGDGPASGGSAP